MIGDIFTELIAGWIGAIVGWLGYRFWSTYKSRFSQNYAKFTYFRVIRLRFRERGDSPYYDRKHHTIDGSTEPVFDETWSLNALQCAIPELLSPVQLTSSGIVDAVQLLPTLDKDADNHPHTRDSAGMFTFSHPEKSTNLAAVGTMINGLQSSENWWFGTTAQYDAQTLVLVIDFSSLPFECCPVRNVRSVLERNRKEIPKSGLESQWFEDHFGDDIFYLKYTNAQKNDVIKFVFDIDESQVPKSRSRRRSSASK